MGWTFRTESIQLHVDYKLFSMNVVNAAVRPIGMKENKKLSGPVNRVRVFLLGASKHQTS